MRLLIPNGSKDRRMVRNHTIAGIKRDLKLSQRSWQKQPDNRLDLKGEFYPCICNYIQLLFSQDGNRKGPL